MKRICASFLAIVMLFATYGYASAVNVTSSRASLTLSRYFAEALTGSGRGEIIISYDVKSSKIATSVGVESIVFYTEDGDYVTSVSGSTRNGTFYRRLQSYGAVQQTEKPVCCQGD